VRKVYDALFDVLFSEFNDSHKAYEHLLQFLAVDNCPPMLMDIEGRLEWFFTNIGIAEKLIQSYNLELIKSDRYDYIGDIYIENVIGATEAGRKGLYLTPQPVVEMMCKCTLGEKNYEKINVLDPCVGTGRFLLTANKYAPNARLFGVDNNLTMIRSAFTNAAIHSISMYLLHADTFKHETDIALSEGRYNWQFANRWDSHMDKLKPINSQKKEKYGQYQYELFKQK